MISGPGWPRLFAQGYGLILAADWAGRTFQAELIRSTELLLCWLLRGDGPSSKHGNKSGRHHQATHDLTSIAGSSPPAKRRIGCFVPRAEKLQFMRCTIARRVASNCAKAAFWVSASVGIARDPDTAKKRLRRIASVAAPTATVRLETVYDHVNHPEFAAKLPQNDPLIQKDGLRDSRRAGALVECGTARPLEDLPNGHRSGDKGDAGFRVSVESSCGGCGARNRRRLRLVG